MVRGCFAFLAFSAGIVAVLVFVALLRSPSSDAVDATAQKEANLQALSPPVPATHQKRHDEQEFSDGCDKRKRSEAFKYAVNQALPPDPFDDAPLMPQLDESTFLTADNSGEPEFVKDSSWQPASPAVCVYSDPDVSVYVPASLFTSRMLSITQGVGRQRERFLGMLLPASTFEGITYWNYKRPRGPEFAMFVLWVNNPELVRYEARQALFDSDRKLALFTYDIPMDSSGQAMGKFTDHQKIDLKDGEHPVTLRVEESLGRLIYQSETAFKVAWDALH